MSQAIEGEVIPADCPLPVKGRRFTLNTARDVRRELANLYSRFQNGKIDADMARTGAFVLRTLLEGIRIDEIERRLVEIEERVRI
jgi:hypothetical protein